MFTMSGAVGVVEWNDVSGTPRGTRSAMRAISRIVCCVWSPNGSWIAAGPKSDGVVHVWETTTFQHLHFHSAAWICALLPFSPDGHWVLTATNEATPSTNDCQIWDVESDRGIRRRLQNVAITFVLYLRSLRIWNTSTGAVHKWAAGLDLSTVICCSACGIYIASSISNTEIGLQRTYDFSTVRVFRNTMTAAAIAFSTDGRTLGWATETRAIFFRRIHDLVSAN